jgi:hypothetical protein
MAVGKAIAIDRLFLDPLCHFDNPDVELTRQEPWPVGLGRHDLCRRGGLKLP